MASRKKYKTLKELATGHLRTFSRLDSAEWTARLGIETGGYVK